MHRLPTFLQLFILNYVSPSDLLLKVAQFNKRTRQLVADNCEKGIMRDGVPERVLVVKNGTRALPAYAVALADLFRLNIDKHDTSGTSYLVRSLGGKQLVLMETCYHVQ